MTCLILRTHLTRINIKNGMRKTRLCFVTISKAVTSRIDCTHLKRHIWKVLSEFSAQRYWQRMERKPTRGSSFIIYPYKSSQPSLQRHYGHMRHAFRIMTCAASRTPVISR
ncbi:hypothetical protein AVEN_182968-1 [Araneus ventricosus]|uniref:Uncharacterized protein n=1 Tax=Araneus ventricosus TaxID=182803 RepID=A0A4Y2KN58_ARAVE|nr:hypothetical protein AVEN_182968-1 [Araneus ventricosus]